MSTLPVTIVITNLNNVRYIEQAVLSVVEPAQQRAQLIVLDDGSTDGSLELLRRLRDEHGFELVENSERLGPTRSKQRGLTLAREPWLFYLDGDDFISPGALRGALDRISRGDCDYCLFEMWHTTADDRHRRHAMSGPTQPISGRDAVLKTMGRWRTHTCGLVRIDVVRRAYEGFEVQSYQDDEVISRRVLGRCELIAGCDGRYYYRQIAKRPSPMRVLGQTCTNLRALEYAVVELGLERSAPEIQEMQEVIRRNVMGATARGWKSSLHAKELADILRRLQSLGIPDAPASQSRQLANRLLPTANALHRLLTRALGDASRGFFPEG